MSTPDTDGKSPFALTLPYQPRQYGVDSRRCENWPSSAPVSLPWQARAIPGKISGMYLRRLRPKSGECGPPNSRGRQPASAARHRKVAVDADADLRAQLNAPYRRRVIPCVSEDSRDAAPESRLKENPPLAYAASL